MSKQYSQHPKNGPVRVVRRRRRSKAERQAWWSSLTPQQKADYVDKKMGK